ncbi:MAG: hypothetical protein Ct9H90mP16_01740 [Candidatus Poseidoniales archaeon]|nr:MAG: hypothetical protein Ct9H90mP16_01740 [Candidatus Poseidoniales archaeon]
MPRSFGDEVGGASMGAPIIFRGQGGAKGQVLGGKEGLIFVVGDCKGDAGQGMTGGGNCSRWKMPSRR